MQASGIAAVVAAGLTAGLKAEQEQDPVLYDKERLMRNLEARLSRYPDHSALVKDLKTGEKLLSHDAYEQSFPASTTKAVVAYGAFKLAEQGKLDLDDKVRIGREVDGSATPSGKLGGPPRTGEKIPVRTLIKQMLVYSDNTASNHILQKVGVDRLRGIIKDDLDLTGTDIERRYFIREGKPLVTTPRDMVVFLEHIYREEKRGGSAAKELLKDMKEGTGERFGEAIDKGLTVRGKYGANGLQEHQIALVEDGNGNAFAMAVYADGMPESKAIPFYSGLFNAFKS